MRITRAVHLTIAIETLLLLIVAGMFAGKLMPLGAEQSPSTRNAAPTSPVDQKTPERSFTLYITGDNKTRFFDWSVKQITVSRGERVALKIVNNSTDPHDFAVPSLSIYAEVKPNIVVTVLFNVQAIGTFKYFCATYCGPSHVKMEGTIRVEA